MIHDFIETHLNAEVISFSDVAHTRGHLYETLGFEKMYTTSPSYVWVTEDDKKYYHRVSCQKQYLRKLFNDDTIDIENQTEKQIMEAHKFARVFDAGVVKWSYNLK